MNLLTKENIEKISNEYYLDIFKFCLLYLQNEEDARDAAQDTFLLLKQKGDRLDDKNIKGWLFCVANNRIHKIFDERKRSNIISDSYEEDLTQIENSIESIEIQLIDYNLNKYVNEVYSALTPVEQKLFEMIYFDRLSKNEIAEELGITVYALYTRINRLKVKVSEYIRNEILF